MEETTADRINKMRSEFFKKKPAEWQIVTYLAEQDPRKEYPWFDHKSLFAAFRIKHGFAPPRVEMSKDVNSSTVGAQKEGWLEIAHQNTSEHHKKIQYRLTAVGRTFYETTIKPAIERIIQEVEKTTGQEPMPTDMGRSDEEKTARNAFFKRQYHSPQPGEDEDSVKKRWCAALIAYMGDHAHDICRVRIKESPIFTTNELNNLFRLTNGYGGYGGDVTDKLRVPWSDRVHAGKSIRSIAMRYGLITQYRENNYTNRATYSLTEEGKKFYAAIQQELVQELASRQTQKPPLANQPPQHTPTPEHTRAAFKHGEHVKRPPKPRSPRDVSPPTLSATNDGSPSPLPTKEERIKSLMKAYSNRKNNYKGEENSSKERS